MTTRIIGTPTIAKKSALNAIFYDLDSGVVAGYLNGQSCPYLYWEDFNPSQPDQSLSGLPLWNEAKRVVEIHHAAPAPSYETMWRFVGGQKEIPKPLYLEIALFESVNFLPSVDKEAAFAAAYQSQGKDWVTGNWPVKVPGMARKPGRSRPLFANAHTGDEGEKIAQINLANQHGGTGFVSDWMINGIGETIPFDIPNPSDLHFSTLIQLMADIGITRKPLWELYRDGDWFIWIDQYLDTGDVEFGTVHGFPAFSVKYKCHRGKLERLTYTVQSQRLITYESVKVSDYPPKWRKSTWAVLSPTLRTGGNLLHYLRTLLTVLANQRFYTHYPFTPKS